MAQWYSTGITTKTYYSSATGTLNPSFNGMIVHFDGAFTSYGTITTPPTVIAVRLDSNASLIAEVPITWDNSNPVGGQDFDLSSVGITSSAKYRFQLCKPGGTELNYQFIATLSMQQAPNQATALTVSQTTTDGYTLTWTAPSSTGGLAKYYNIWDNGVLIASGITATTYTASGLQAGTYHNLQVEAVNDYGSSMSATKTWCVFQVGATTWNTSIAGNTITYDCIMPNMNAAGYFKLFLQYSTHKLGFQYQGSMTYTSGTFRIFDENGIQVYQSSLNLNASFGVSTGNYYVTDFVVDPNHNYTAGFYSNTNALSTVPGVSETLYNTDYQGANVAQINSIYESWNGGSARYNIRPSWDFASKTLTFNGTFTPSTTCTTWRIRLKGQTTDLLNVAYAFPISLTYDFQPNTQYEIHPYTSNTSSMGTYGFTWVGPTPPNTPTGLNVTEDNATGNLNLTWDTVTNAESYKVYDNGVSIATGLTGVSYTVTSPTIGSHSYQVSAFGNGVESSLSTAVAYSVSLPPAPVGVSVSQNANGQDLDVSWTLESELDIRYYNIYRNGSLVGSTSNRTTSSFTDVKPPLGLVSYTVSATDPYGEGAQSNSASFTVVPLNSPSNLHALVNPPNVQLTWGQVLGADSYSVYRDGVLLASGITVVSYTDTTLAKGTTGNYSVSATNYLGESVQSASVSAYMPNPPSEVPTNIQVSVNGYSTTVTWSAISNATSYKVYKDSVLVNTVSTNTITYADSEGSHSVQVEAINGDGSSGLSPATDYVVAHVTNLPDNVTNLVITVVNNYTMNMTWDLVSDATSYNVYINDVATNVPSNSYSITEPKSSYNIAVSGVNADGEGSLTPVQTVNIQDPIPDTPLNFTVNVDGYTITATWSASTHASYYNLYVNGSPISMAGTSYSFTKPSGSYQLQVSAVNDTGESAKTGIQTVQVIDPIPDVPTNVLVQVNGYDISVSWDLNSIATSYNVYVNGIATNVTTNSFTTTKVAGSYTIAVSSLNSSGESGRSANQLAQVNDPIPSVPTNVQVSVNGYEVTVTWDNVNLADSYNVYVNDVAHLVNVNSFTFTEPKGNYNIQVSSIDESGESSKSAVKVAQVLDPTPDTPTNVLVIVNGFEVSISWDSMNYATSYNVYINDVPVSTSETSFITNKEAGSYDIEVSSSNETGESARSLAQTIIIKNPIPLTPDNLQVSISGYQLDISWNSVDYATSYNVYINNVPTNVLLNSFSVTELAGDYQIQISAVNSTGESALTPIVNATIIEIPDTPTHVVLSVKGYELTVVWDEMPRATSYSVIVNGVSTTINQSPYVVTEVAGNYEVQVSASNQTGTSPLSLIQSTLIYDPPTLPDLKATLDKYDITMNWNLVNANSYNIYVNGVLVDTTVNDIYLLTDLAVNSYQLQIEAVNPAGSVLSNTVTIQVIEYISPPTNVKVEVNGKYVDVTWDGVRDAVKYQILVNNHVVIETDKPYIRLVNVMGQLKGVE